MFLITRSPGAFIALAAAVVYGVVAAEIWMWTVASTAAVAAVLALIAVCAVLICRSVVALMADDAAPVPSTAPAAADARPAPARTARPRLRPVAH
ncbi:hypothetical protein [Paraconexibacter algicola]|uniref:Uncharacterized protein n=1 Tax=Paraconexibacter algicola TaxID=2133960 RepID=A0A2T4UKL0_9ACTN|nr:hypothetical protein [Paraconexibacter algicola]PTL59751.1 hypothetical protein C7Y72_08840 [Paraconexibacter algicola]